MGMPAGRSWVMIRTIALETNDSGSGSDQAPDGERAFVTPACAAAVRQGATTMSATSSATVDTRSRLVREGRTVEREIIMVCWRIQV